jgi:hypothetical protein
MNEQRLEVTSSIRKETFNNLFKKSSPCGIKWSTAGGDYVRCGRCVRSTTTRLLARHARWLSQYVPGVLLLPGSEFRGRVSHRRRIIHRVPKSPLLRKMTALGDGNDCLSESAFALKAGTYYVPTGRRANLNFHVYRA